MRDTNGTKLELGDIVAISYKHRVETTAIEEIGENYIKVFVGWHLIKICSSKRILYLT